MISSALRGWTTAPDPVPIDREAQRARLREPRRWDLVIIGGGATGLGVAVDAALRGLRVALIEASDFAAGTSSRSTKLVHGGVRYLAQGNLKLVREALAERAILLRLAPHVVQPLPFVVPCFGRIEQSMLRLGLGLYDALAGNRGIGATEWLSCAETLQRLPGLQSDGLRGGVLYWDAQFDDARMAIALLQTAHQLGAVALNGLRCTGLVREGGRIATVVAEDQETGERLHLRTGCVVNACGVWIDPIRRLADPDAQPVVRVSQGSHLVIARDFLPGDAALMIPRTRDGRVLFAVPWQGRLIVGTTDVARGDAPAEPQPSPEEVEFICNAAQEYLSRPIRPEDVQSSFAGLRPLYSPRDATLAHSGSTAAISREHAVLIEHGNLISVIGGKWTTYRRMAADTLAAAQRAGCLPIATADTASLPLVQDRMLQAAAAEPTRLTSDDQRRSELIAYCARYTLARNAEDALTRRSRAVLLGYRAAAAIDGNVTLGARSPGQPGDRSA